MAHFLEPCLPCLKVSLKYLCLSSQEISWPGPSVNGFRKEEINTSPLESGWNQEIFATTYYLFYFTSLLPHLCSIKETRIQTQAIWLFWTLVHHLLSLLALWIKSLFLAPTICLSMYWLVVQWAIQAWTW